MSLFTLKNVSFADIIHYPDLEISAGSTTFICGESGSGKSTLLKLLNGVISPSSGCITYAGQNLADYNPISLRRDVLLVSQAVYLFDQSIKENFHTYYAYRDLDKIDDALMQQHLKACAVHLPLDSMCNLLSGGERQRVFTAINLSFGFKVLMMDEPTSALDDKNAQALISNIKSTCQEKGLTLIIVSHDRAIADQYADHIINLEGGVK